MSQTIEAYTNIASEKIEMHNSIHNFIFPQGLIGFKDAHQYTLMIPPQNISVPHYLFLQSLDIPGLCFIVVPFDFTDPLIEEEDLQAAFNELCILPENGRIFLIATPKRHDQRIQIMVNLRAPIILDIDMNQGWQYIFQNTDYPLQHTIEQTSMLV